MLNPVMRRVAPWILVPPERAVQTMLFAATAAPHLVSAHLSGFSSALQGQSCWQVHLLGEALYSASWLQHSLASAWPSFVMNVKPKAFLVRASDNPLRNLLTSCSMPIAD